MSTPRSVRGVTRRQANYLRSADETEPVILLQYEFA